MAICTLVDKNWSNGVNVQVSLGKASVCDNNPVKHAKRLLFNQSWPVDVGTDLGLCCRRDSDPDLPNGSMTAWVSISFPQGKTEYI